MHDVKVNVKEASAEVLKKSLFFWSKRGHQNDHILSDECQKFEVFGGSSKTKGIYTRVVLGDYINVTLDQKNLTVWKKPTEDRFIFNKGDSSGWRIGIEGHIVTGNSYFYKSKGL